jgi:putative transposase
MTKNEQIRLTLLETQKRRQNQILKVYEVKVDCHHVSKEDLKKLNHLFVETKWIQNDVIASNDIFKYDYKQHRKITNFDRDRNEVERDITIQTGVHQAVVKQIQQDICNLSKSKKKGIKVGRLKFRRNCSNIPLKTGMLKIKSSKQISIPSFRKLNVYGLEQFINFPEYEIANANIVKKASGIYIKISVLVPKQSLKRKSTGKTVGLDFGIKDNIITSDGEKFNCSVQESDYLKFLQRKLSKKQKESRRYYKCLNQLQKEYEHLTNKRNDDSNKLISYLKKEYDIIFYQDEQIAKWRKFNRGFAKNIQHSYLGRVKAKLRELSKNNRAFEISKWTPSTKYCPQCGSLNNGIQLSDRTFKCDCGYQFDRDVHAAKNVKLFGSTKRAECLEQTSVDKLASIALSM